MTKEQNVDKAACDDWTKIPVHCAECGVQFLRKVRHQKYCDEHRHLGGAVIRPQEAPTSKERVDWRVLCLKLRDAVQAEGQAMQWGAGVKRARRELAAVWEEVEQAEKSPDETTGSIGTVTLTADEFQSLMAEKEKLTSDLADADRINSDSVNRLCALEAEIADETSHMNAANAVLTARVKRLRKRIGQAYDLLAAASSEDSMGESLPEEPSEPRMPLEHYRVENGKLRKAMADLMHKCPRCRAEAKEALSAMTRKAHHPRCELMQPHGHEPPKCTCPSEKAAGESRAEFERDRGFVRRCLKCGEELGPDGHHTHDDVPDLL